MRRRASLIWRRYWKKRKEALDQAESAKVKGLLTEKGIEFAETATLDELKALLPAE